MSILHWISADSRRRFAMSVATAVAAYLVLPARCSFPIRAITVWDTFAVVSILLAWVAITLTPQDQLRAHARVQDLSRLLIFSFVVAAACIALLSVGFIIRNH